METESTVAFSGGGRKWNNALVEAPKRKAPHLQKKDNSMEGRLLCGHAQAQ
jgi:hypothetical protein